MIIILPREKGFGCLMKRLDTYAFENKTRDEQHADTITVLIARSARLIRERCHSSSALGPDGYSEVTLSSAPESSDICLSIFCRRSSCWTGRALKIVYGRKTRRDETNHEKPAAGYKNC